LAVTAKRNFVTIT